MTRHKRLTPEIKAQFCSLENQLSPENLCCDGEISTTRAKQRYKEIRKQWSELEQLIGMKVTSEMVYPWYAEVNQKG